MCAKQHIKDPVASPAMETQLWVLDYQTAGVAPEPRRFAGCAVRGSTCFWRCPDVHSQKKTTLIIHGVRYTLGILQQHLLQGMWFTSQIPTALLLPVVCQNESQAARLVA